MSRKEPTFELVLELIEGLQKTQATQVWVRRDIAEFALGEATNDKLCVHSAVLGQKETKRRNLIEAMREAGTVFSDQLGCYDRPVLLSALLEWAETSRDAPNLYTNKVAEESKNLLEGFDGVQN